MEHLEEFTKCTTHEKFVTSIKYMLHKLMSEGHKVAYCMQMIWIAGEI